MEQNSLMKTVNDNHSVIPQETATRRTKIIIHRTFGKQDLLELYSEYVAERIMSADHGLRQANRTTA